MAPGSKSRRRFIARSTTNCAIGSSRASAIWGRTVPHRASMRAAMPTRSKNPNAAEIGRSWRISANRHARAAPVPRQRSGSSTPARRRKVHPRDNTIAPMGGLLLVLPAVLDPHNSLRFAIRQEAYWMPVDLYSAGSNMRSYTCSTRVFGIGALRPGPLSTPSLLRVSSTRG